MLSVTRPTPLRLAGFLAGALGGLLVGLGSIVTWATVTIGQKSTTNVLPPVDTKGIDTVEGKVALAAGLVILIAIPAMRLASAGRGRRAWALLIIVAGLTAGGLALSGAARSNERFGRIGFEETVKRVAEANGLPMVQARRQVERSTANVTEVAIKPGLFLAAAGGVLAVVGGSLSLAWAARKERSGRAAEPPATGSNAGA